jgi:hypothetical protein
MVEIALVSKEGKLLEIKEISDAYRYQPCHEEDDT